MINLKQKLLDLKLVKDNEYLDKYIKLIELNKETKREKFKTQKHHIIPKYYYKYNNMVINNSKENLVNLVYKDHILAHYYLYKCSFIDEYIHSNLYALQYILKNKKIDSMDMNETELEDLQNEYKISCRVRFNKTHSLKCAEKIRLKLVGRPSPNKGNKSNIIKIKKISNNIKNIKLSELASQRIGIKNSFYGKHHSDSTKRTIAEKNGNSVEMLDYNTKKVLHKFISALDASRYLVEIGATTNKSANHRILDVCKSNNLDNHAYGYC